MESLLARVFNRVGDTEQAARFLELRHAKLTEALTSSSVKDFLFPEWFNATAELMLLCIRTEDFKRASELFVTASSRFAGLEKPPEAWFTPVLVVLGEVAGRGC